MVRHVLLLTLRDGLTPSEIETLSQGFDELIRSVDEIQGAAHGRALNLPGSSVQPSDYAVTLDFADEAAFARYIVHPAHRAFIERYLAPVRSGGTSAQIRIG